jgi:general secretion pathway protein C
MKLDKILKRHFWVVILSFVAVAAFFHAQAVTQIIGFRLAPDEKQLAAIPSATGRRLLPAASSTNQRNLSAATILGRNPFDSVTGPLNEDPLDITVPTLGSAAAVNDSDPMHAPDCDGLKVVAIAASTDPDWSFASFTPLTPAAAGSAVTSAGTPDLRPILRRRGGDVGGKKVEFIGWDRVWLSSTTGLCQLGMFKPPAPPPSASAKPAAKSSGGDELTKEISKGIQKISPTEFKIERGVVDKILENTAALMTQVRIVPEKDGEKSTGIRLFGVKPDSLLGVLGMENGDKLQTINGFDMTNPEKALEAYARLRTADHLTVAVNRKGANTNLDYNIQ